MGNNLETATTILPTDMKLLKLRDDFNRYIEGWLDYYKKKGHRLALYSKDLTIEEGRTVYKAVYLDTYTKEKIHIIKEYSDVEKGQLGL